MATSNTPYQPDYTLYQSKGLTVAQLDMLANFVFGGTAPSTLSAIIAAIKLAIAIAYITARQIMVNNEIAIAKQAYEADQHRRNSDDLGRDDLDVKK
jgi:hypothetical protein